MFTPDLFLKESYDDFLDSKDNFLNAPPTKYGQIEKLRKFKYEGFKNEDERKAALLMISELRRANTGRVFFVSDARDVIIAAAKAILNLILLPTFAVIGILALWMLGTLGLSVLWFLVTKQKIENSSVGTLVFNMKIKEKKVIVNEDLVESLLSEENTLDDSDVTLENLKNKIKEANLTGDENNQVIRATETIIDRVRESIRLAKKANKMGALKATLLTITTLAFGMMLTLTIALGVIILMILSIIIFFLYSFMVFRNGGSEEAFNRRLNELERAIKEAPVRA